MDDSEHNIGAYGNQCMFSDEESTLFTNEDATFDYCRQAEESSAAAAKAEEEDGADVVEGVAASDSVNADDGVNSTASDGTNANGFHGFKSLRSFPISSRLGEGESIRCYISEDGLKAKRKVEKIKAKKAAGWTKANDLEGHKDFDAVDDVLDFLGVAGDNSSSQEQKKKLKKRSKLKSSSSRQESMNGKCSSSTASDSDHELHSSSRYSQQVITINDMCSMNGTVGEQILSSDSSFTASNIRPLDSVENGSDTQPPVDEEFKEVHRRKKTHPRHIVAAAASVERSKPATASRALNRHNKQDSCRPASAAVGQPKATAVAEVTMDLSINSFPLLESPHFGVGDTKSSAHTESTRTSIFTESATDDDRDSVASQSACCSQKASWAKIAAKRGTSNPTYSSNEPSSASTAHIVNHKTPSPDNDGTPRTVSQSSGNTYQREETFPITDQNCFMTRSASALSEIEFGTVTTSSDVMADRHVHDILSQSFTEGQTRFKLCAQSRNISKLVKAPTGGKSSKSVAVKQSIRGKGVEFFDEYADQPRPNINIVFGFENNDELAQVSERSDCKLATSLNPPSTSQHNLVLCSTNTSFTTTTAIQCTASAVTTGYRDNSYVLPQTTDVLPQFLAAACDESIYNKHSLTHAHHSNSNFNLANAVSMLKKEWDVVIEKRNKHGDESVKLSAELRAN